MKESIEKHLKEKGLKITNQRKAILEAFQNPEKHLLTAAEVLEIVSKYTDKLNFSTVYRNLETLTEVGILKRINLDNGINNYELDIENHHHHHLICLSCGDAKTIDYCPFDEMRISNKQLQDFTPVDHKLEIYGYCKKCGNNMSCDKLNKKQKVSK
ncbi:ferric uptake regulator, Fur family [Alkaliphilus metalliredigens QYMF]|uniref:Ferric uptake regulator, Fur family n=1 Tax=Alkaliphilus metalliredigens (strain QYMF) TaxID=293826 RepID=A6TQL9_ALKMQ|nr:Fur family transcriptional regulator [Alkaliphilus metalliredigens]ABR48487.1 ferric uptake regulator, Fur family [Alkaliphilus metalliredigens QYMF]